ncbi:Alpha/Beta hydrolase protein [Ilyonectria robusta]|uniref:Alpha/Beta hydrolase protein n=1 Tax=Ilyonectria robusta TaxID=1079257 RepID=UPI001E8D9D1E|nr:Alpha/Beta hydrolase protein [Ilyonectria robusta]KAH8714469.1 Alpha/Beta hydrolase protein [Ilyonectria robusta]
MATYETAKDQFVTVDGIKFAYRHLGPSHGVPLVLLVGFRGTMDHWDPALINPLAAKRPVILIDNAGVGRSEGEVPKSLTAWAQYYVNVLQALGVKKADIMGFSMGGCVAQLVALNAPDLTRRLILCGTTPSNGEGVVSAPIGPFNALKAAATEQEHKDAWIHGLFNTSDGNWEAGEASWKRMMAARPNRIGNVDAANAHRQAVAFAKFMGAKQAKEASYDRLDQLRMPVLIANGAEDLLLPSENSYLMWKKLNKANAQLHLFPNCGHGFLFQYAQEFSKMINDFLDREEKPQSRL